MVISADSKLHFRPVSGGISKFKGLIGIALWVHDTAVFKARLNSALDRFFLDNRLNRLKKIYSASEIAHLLPGPSWKLRGALRKLARELMAIPETHINAYYLTLDILELRQRKYLELPEETREQEIRKLQAQGADAKVVQIYGEPGRDAVEYVSVTEFIEKVGQYFPVVCAHSLCTFLAIKGEEIVLDGCSGPRSRAWDELVQLGNTLTVVPHSDTYNPYVSVADILTRWIDEELRQGKLPLNQNAVTRVMKEWEGVTSDLDTSHVHIVHISNKDLGIIKPLSKETIDRFQWAFMRHPVFYIFQEERDEDERARVENSPLFSLVHNRVFDQDGSYVWWKPEIHARMIRKGDVTVIYGDKGLNEARNLQTLRYPIEIWDLRKEEIKESI